MPPVTDDLAKILSTVRRPGDFFVSGTIAMHAPLLEVDGVGPVALPLLPVQAEQLVAAAERAPYGRGAETLVDTSVRRTWQIGADRVRIQGRHWARTLDAILARVAAGLGVSEPIEAEFYKLLIYDEGSFFASHRDTEKAPGMFATLVIVLPSISTGGEFVVRHKDREARLDLRPPEPSEAAFAAFYADCVHEVLPVTSGCRLTLVYNLLRPGPGRKPEPPSYEREQARVTALLRAWGAGTAPEAEPPEKLVYLLDHAYTPAELGFESLKGADAAAAAVLVAAAQRSDCDLHLALLSVEESGAAEYTGYYDSRRRWSGPAENEFEAGEVFERSVTLSEWRRPDGSHAALAEVPVEEEELSPPDALDDLDPDEEHFHEATGNEGASFERSYRRAALVLWPRHRFFAVLCQAGLPATLAHLSDLTERWAAAGEERDSPLWRQAHELSGFMLSGWRPHGTYRPRRDMPSNAARMLMLLTRLADTARIEELLAEIAAAGRYDADDNDAIMAAIALLPPRQAAAAIERLVAGTAATSRNACAALLVRAIAAPALAREADLAGAAAALVEALPGDPQRPRTGEPWQRDPPVEPGFIADLLTALCRIHDGLAERAADTILAWPQTYDPDAVLVPAVRALTGSDAIGCPAAERLRIACLEHLRARIAEPLEAPRDWRRASVLPCRCPHCSELSQFLADPERRVWTCKAPEAIRAHVENSIQRAHCDVDVTTDTRGRPYTLVCTKNQASYERRAKQRRSDLDNLARLER